MLRTLIPAFAALALAACATAEQSQTAAAPDRDCFRASQVNGFSTIDNDHIRVSVSANRNYILTTMFNARDLDWSHAIAVRSANGWICTGNGLGVEIIGGDPQRTYPITQVEREPDTNAAQGS